MNSAAALPSFSEDLRLHAQAEQLIVLSGSDAAATIKAAADRTNGANAGIPPPQQLPSWDIVGPG